MKGPDPRRLASSPRENGGASIAPMGRIVTFVAAMVLMLTTTVSVADQNDPRLSALFKNLLSAPDPTAARDVESKIWLIWAETGDPERNKAFQFGSQAMALGDYGTALAVFLSMTRDVPDFAEGWNKLATVEYLMGNYLSSLKSIDRTLALEPRHFGALAGLGLVNMELERDEAALDAFERVLTIYPMSEPARANADFIRQHLKDKAI